ncbi:MAG: histidine kinase dimerization/phospho-acceptor domain-containing protein [Thomasclavelia ramosa]
MNNTHFKQSLTANLLKKIGITISVTVVTFVILLLYSYEVYHQYIWQEYDLVYQVAQIIKDNLVTISITLIAFDTIIIFWLRYRESLQYIEKMLEAGKTLVADNNYLISLPYELKEIEDQMNQIKRESLQNKKAIKQAEQQRNDLLLYLAHDLKTPLTSIVGYLDLLMNQPNLTIEEKAIIPKLPMIKLFVLKN